MSQPRQFVLGTRASPLALWQSRHVAEALGAAQGWPDGRIDIHEIVTRGDKRLDMKLAEIGGKGLFTEELEAGLREGSLDLAVHSLKDLPTAMPEGLVLAAVLPRADARDVLVPHPQLNMRSLADLPEGAKIGTASLRRQAQLKARRPDLQIEALRGNINTRLARLQEDGFAATLLAAAGLQRLGLTPHGAVTLSPDDILPAAGQGALAVQCRAEDADMRRLLAHLTCADTLDCVTAERSFLAALDGSCRTPIAALAEISAGELVLRGRLLSDDGTHDEAGAISGPRTKAAELGRRLAAQVRDAMTARLAAAGQG